MTNLLIAITLLTLVWLIDKWHRRNSGMKHYDVTR